MSAASSVCLVSTWRYLFFFFFFFQAEDGIRDLTVTGVQTCALPISPSDDAPAARGGEGYRGARCPGIRRPEGGDRPDGGTRRRRVGLRRPPRRAVEETRTSDSICRAARGKGPEEAGRRRIPGGPVVQNER